MSHLNRDQIESDILFRENENRFTLFPIQNQKIWDAYVIHKKAFWQAEEIDLSKDKEQFLKLTHKQQHFIKHVLAFFAASDGIIVENLALRFIKDVQLPEARSFYGFQLMMENIHSETYSLLIDTYISDTQEKQKLFNAITTIPTIAKKAQWAMKWINSSDSFAERLWAFAIVEGVFFSGSFCAIYYFKQSGKLPGLAQANELISRDEGLHAQFACLLYGLMKNKLDRSRVLEIFTEGVEIEKEFVCDSLPVELLGMNSKMMCSYIEYVADYLLTMIGEKVYYGTQNPFDWMEQISLVGHTNFFDKRVTDYQMTGTIAISTDTSDDF
jgi:ribonucleotide reductase beta subunit family protein with ferritin-like domain